MGRLVHELLDEAVAKAPSRCAVRDAAADWSYADISTLSHGFAQWLRENGIGTGDRVLTQLPSTGEAVAMLYGASRIGAVLVPVNPAMKPFLLKSVIADCEPRLMIADGDPENAARELGMVEVHGLSRIWPHVMANREARVSGTEVREQDPAVLVYTSGSSATPKAVICPHAQMTFATEAIAQVLGYRDEDVVFCRFPLSWDYGLYKVLLCALARCTLVLADTESDLVLLKRMRETGTTVVPLVPSLAAMITTLAARDTEPAPPVRLLTNTGAALSASLTDALREAFPGAQVVRQYGQTECKRVSIMPPQTADERPGSVGLPLPGSRVLILSPDGAEVPPGGSGEIVVEGPHVMPGYWNAPELTAAAFRTAPATGARRLHTGDYGRLDADGYLYFEGRRDDMFKRKGIRMSTLEIEAAALDIPGVRAAAALAPDGERDLALFVDADLAGHQVLRELAARLEPAKVPAVCRVLTDWPLTQNGKNAKQVLARRFETGS